MEPKRGWSGLTNGSKATLSSSRSTRNSNAAQPHQVSVGGSSDIIDHLAVENYTACQLSRLRN